MSTAILANPRWQQPVFSVHPTDYDWIDVFLYAMVRGDWAAFETRLFEGLVCAAEAAEAELSADEARVDEAATSFRYDRDLLTTEETMAWLEQAGLTLEDWTDFLSRCILRDAWCERLPALLERHRASITITDAAFAAEGLCSPAFKEFAQTLAGRAALAATLDPTVTVGRPFKVAKLVSRHAMWLDGIDSNTLAERLLHLSGIDTHFAAQVQSLKTEPRLALQVSRNRLEWMRVDLERLSFKDEPSAREAILCVREDGLTFEDVAIDSHQTVRDTAEILERLEPELRDAVLSASVDDVIGPILVGDRYEIAMLVGKKAAELSDPLVRARAEEAAVESLVSKAILSHVHWVR